MHITNNNRSIDKLIATKVDARLVKERDEKV